VRLETRGTFDYSEGLNFGAAKKGESASQIKKKKVARFWKKHQRATWGKKDFDLGKDQRRYGRNGGNKSAQNSAAKGRLKANKTKFLKQQKNRWRWSREKMGRGFRS